jgi:hypothetical protein
MGRCNDVANIGSAGVEGVERDPRTHGSGERGVQNHMIWISAVLAVGSPGLIPSEPSAPVLQLIEQPGVVLGDDRKLMFALYDDGTVLHAAPRSTWARGANGFPVARYVLTKLPPGEKQRLLAKLRPEELHTLKKRVYEGCRSHITRSAGSTTFSGCPTDQPLYTFVARNAGSTARVSLYFGLSPGSHSNRPAAPPVLVRLWDALSDFDAAGEGWRPTSMLVTFRNHARDIPRERRASIGCVWPEELAADFPSGEQLEKGRVLRVLPQSRRPVVHDWILRCSSLARVQDRFVLVRAYDLFPGEPPEEVPLKEPGEE